MQDYLLLACCVRCAGLRYGKFLFLQFPLFGQILAPLDPLIRLYFSFPFARYVAQISVGRAWLTEDASVMHVFLCLSSCASINHALLCFRLLVEREIWFSVLRTFLLRGKHSFLCFALSAEAQRQR